MQIKAYCQFLLVLSLISLSLINLAWADCTSPTAKEGAREFFPDDDNYKICIQGLWVELKLSQLSGSCSGATDVEGRMEYDTTLKAFKFCDGINTQEVLCFDQCESRALTYSVPGFLSYIIPGNCTSVDIEAYGAGGGGTGDRGGGGGGGGSVVRNNSGSSLIAAGGGGGGGGGTENTDNEGGGGGYGYDNDYSVSAGDILDIWVGGGGSVNSIDNGGTGGAVGGGTEGNNAQTQADGSKYGGGGGGARRNPGGDGGASGGNADFGGAGGGGSEDVGGNAEYGGAGGAGDDGGSCGSSSDGGACSGMDGGGGGWYGEGGSQGTAGGAAANSGPGDGGSNDNGGDGQVVITRDALAGCRTIAGSCTEGALEYISNELRYCDGTQWVAIAY